METREQLMKRFGLKETNKPPSPVKFRHHGELSTLEKEAQHAAHEAIDTLVESRGGYKKLYGQSLTKPPFKKPHATDLAR